MSGDADAVDRLVAADADILDRLREGRPTLIRDAAEMGHVAGVRLLAVLGWDVNAVRRTSALHEAALRDDVGLARVLLELGADPDGVDAEFGSTPLGWATHGGHQRMIDLFAPLTTPPEN